MSKRSKKTISIVAMLTVLLVSAFCLGTTLQTKSIASAEVVDREAILYYDFSDSTIGESVDGYSSVTNLGTKQGANATIFNGTGLTVNNQLVFSQKNHCDTEPNRNLEPRTGKAYFELPVASFDGLTSFTVQMDVNLVDGGGDREPIFAMTQTSLSNTIFGDYNQGILFGDGYIDSADFTYMESWLNGWNIQKTPTRPFIEGKNYLVTFKFDGANVSVYYDNTLILQRANSDVNLFSNYDYFRIGGSMMNWTGALNGNIDNVKVYDYARSIDQISEDAARIYASRVTEAGAAPVVYYDFEEAPTNGKTVLNKGTGLSLAGASSNGTIVQTKNDVYVQDGKLVIDNPSTDLSTNGYFLLPKYLFYQLTSWTIEMKIDHLYIDDNNCSFLSFSRSDPTVTEIGSNNGTQQIFWNWNGSVNGYTPHYQGRYESMWTVGNTNIANANVNEPRTIALVLNDSALSFVYNNQTIWTTSKVHTGTYFTYFLHNKIGGYLYDWGRSSAEVTIDSFAFYDYARTNDQIAGFNGQVEHVVANIENNATSVTSYTAYDRFGNEVDANVIFPSDLDLATVGTRTSYVTVANQAAPARFTLKVTKHEHADADNNGVCDSCNEVLEDTAYGINLSLDGTIKANVYMLLTDATLSDTNAVMRTEFDGNITDVKLADAKQVVDNGLTYYVFSCDVPAKLMDATIKSYLVYGDETTGTEYVYSVAEYADKLLSDTTGAYDDAKELISATANYGDFSKAFFAGEELEATDAMNAVTATTLEAYNYSVSGTLADGISIYGVNLILESETSIRVYLSVANGHTIDEYTLKIDGVEVTAVANGDFYYVEISDISAKDLDKEFVVSINDYSLELSALSYAGIVLNNGNDVALTKVMQALYLYNQAANAYLG